MDVANLKCDDCGYESGMSELKAAKDLIALLEAKLAVEKKRADDATQYADRAVSEICALASALHYPYCWDTAAYPNLEACINELFVCNTCRNGEE